MKNLSAIFLLSVYLVSATQFQELFKINTLIAHFNETKADDSSISFIDFLVMHYITDDGNKKDDDRDGQLPFKSHGAVAGNGPIFILNRPQEIISTQAREIKRDFNNYRDPSFNATFRDLVWNPPKVA